MSKRLRSLQVLSSYERTSSVDVFRGVAIVGVLLFHYYNLLPYGYLGVDLFFVVSGLLVGGILVKAFATPKSVQYIPFILRRGGKIWPSYYFFIIIGTLLAHLLYSTTHPDQIISLWDMKRYLFFYQNYTGVPFHWSFDHVWSLCVEEHFYLLVPWVFIIAQRFFNSSPKALLFFILLAIVAGFVFKILTLEYSTGKDTYAATHNRIDALAYGVLLSMIIHFRGEKIRDSGYCTFLFFFGLFFLATLIFVDISQHNLFYSKVVFHSLTPLAFMLMILGVYHKSAPTAFYPIRFMAYYSYNWYLWHPIFVFLISDYFGKSALGFLAYFLISFLTAFLVTLVVEEPCLELRDKFLKRSQ